MMSPAEVSAMFLICAIGGLLAGYGFGRFNSPSPVIRRERRRDGDGWMDGVRPDEEYYRENQ